jgi:hypothetical protein
VCVCVCACVWVCVCVVWTALRQGCARSGELRAALPVVLHHGEHGSWDLQEESAPPDPGAIP